MRLEMLQNMSSGIPSKVRAGGQSSQRFHRITEGLTKEFYKRVAEEMKSLFYNEPKLKGILVGGPVPTKDEFVEGGYLPTRLQDKIIGLKDQGDTSKAGLQDLVELSQDVLANQEIIHEKKLLERFFNNLGKHPEMTPYKFDEVKKALDYGAVEVIIISKNYDKAKTKELKKIADQMGTRIEVVSTETEEGEQFSNLSGIGAIQRFGI
jgi:peptide chain release factor subunit 1